MRSFWIGLLLIIGFMCFVGSATAASTSSVTFAWDAVNVADLGGYRLYQSTVTGTYNKATGKVCDVGKTINTCTVTGLADGTYYFVATAYDTNGNESGLSNEVNKTTDTISPGAPPGLRIITTIVVTVGQ